MSAASHRPPFSIADARHLAYRVWGIEGDASELPSSADRNFLLTDSDGAHSVLKISAAGERAELLELENRVLAHLAATTSLPTPRVLPTLEGDEMHWLERGGERYAMRRVSHCPGRHLAAVPASPELYRRLGALLGTLDRSLARSALERQPGGQRVLDWDLAHTPRVVRERLAAIDGAQRRELVSGVLERAACFLEPLWPRLRRSLIHNDANDWNVLVAPADSSEQERVGPTRISGLVDFGDLVVTATVCELAIAATYAMFEQPDPLHAIEPLVAGYHAEHPLREDELAALLPLVQLRLCLSVTQSAWLRAREPENTYHAVSESSAWQLLAGLSAVHPRRAAWRFRRVCGLEPVPDAALVRSALAAAQPAPILGAPLTGGNVVVFDFAIDSPLQTRLDDPYDHRQWGMLLFRELEGAGGATGWGRYDEARSWYDTPAFAVAGEEARTVHLGVDLFRPPDTTVYAPLAGRVHSLADNASERDYGPTLILEHELESNGDGARCYTLFGHLRRDLLDQRHPGESIAAGQAIAHLGDYPENGGWAPHLHFQIIVDLLDAAGDFPGVALPSERDLWLANCPDPNLLLRLPTAVLEPKPHRDGLAARRRRVLAPSLSLSYREPLTILRGEGAHLLDASGRRFVDLANNVAHVGHAHPRVVRAAATQKALLETNTRYLHPLVLEYAERLLDKMPAPLEVCFFVNSGSEANDLALRLARTATRRRDVLCLEGAYHGNLGTLIDVSPYKHDGPGGQGTPAHVRKLPMPDVYRGPHRGEDAGKRYAVAVEAACRLSHETSTGPAAFLCESLLSCGGQIPLPDGYLESAYQHVRAAGGVSIADEVQVGLGRLGSHFWGFATQGVIPDIVTLGKPLGNGHPLAAVVTTRALAEAFANGMEYFNTFGGNPASCAVGLAVLDVIEEEGLQERAGRLGTDLLERLRELQARHPSIGDVRGRGLFLGIDLVRDHETREPDAALASHVVEAMLQRRFLLSTDGPAHNVIKIKPPLVIDEGDLERFLAALDAVLSRVAR